MVPPVCGCGKGLTVMSATGRLKWSAREGECWNWHEGLAYWTYCHLCHLSLWHNDKRSRNGSGLPGSPGARPQNWQGNRVAQVAGDLWLTSFPERRSQAALQTKPPPTARPSRAQPAQAHEMEDWWWVAPAKGARTPSRSRSRSPTTAPEAHRHSLDTAPCRKQRREPWEPKRATGPTWADRGRWTHEVLSNARRILFAY